MKFRIALAILAVAVTWLGLAPAASAAARPAASSDLTASSQCSAAYFHNDPRLGPLQLAHSGMDGTELRGYQRTGTLTVSRFLATYWNPAANSGAGGWIYPPDDGFVVGPDGQPEVSQLTLQADSDIDRYGSPFGSILSPAGLPYAMRSNPPQNLDSTPPASCNYHEYQVLRSFTVDAGPIAPWFGQPGYGAQYQLDPALIPGAPADLNVLWLVDNGFLEPIS